MSATLPLKILGLIGPFLCRVERAHKPGFPEGWLADSGSPEEQEQAWLMRELPTYSHDNLDEIIRLERDPPRTADRIRARDRNGEPVNTFALPIGFDLVRAFRLLSEHYFQWAGNELQIRERRMVELHELAIRFPVRHIIRFRHADAVAQGYLSVDRALELPAQMSQLHSTYQGLRIVIERGLSEGHVHLNGVINADETWADHLLRWLSPGALEGFRPEAERLLVLGRAAVRLLALGVLYSFVNPDAATLPFRLIDHLDRMYWAGSRIEERIARQALSEGFREIVEDFSKLLQNRNLRNATADLDWVMSLFNPGMHRLWRRDNRSLRSRAVLEAPGIRSRIRLLERLHFTVHRLLVERNRDATSSSLDPPEVDRENSAQERLQDPLRDFVHQVFFRYLIYHTHHWQAATQSGKTTGLRNFQRFFGARQRSPLTNWTEIQGLAIEQLTQTEAMRNVEGRLSPPPNGPPELMPWVVAFADQAHQGKLDKFGIVIHFIKAKHGEADHLTPGKISSWLRYGRIRRTTQADAFRLFRLLSTPHPVVPFIVGIDAANLELTTPPEVFAPAFRFLREYPIELQQHATAKENFRKYREIISLVENRRLGMTYHVGEDFRHLLSGLRAIDEVIEFLNPLPGDRLGHALALALEPEVWASQIGYQAILPKQEWLDTLVWLHHLLGPGHDLIGELAFEDEIQRYSKEIYGTTDPIQRANSGSHPPASNVHIERDWTPPTLYDAWRLRQLDPYNDGVKQLFASDYRISQRSGPGAQHKRWANVQRKVLEEVKQYIGSNAAYNLLRRYWFSDKVRRAGDKIITVDMQSKKKLWLAVCQEAQEKLRQRVQDRQLVVEVNPSSNRVIGPMARLEDHPIFRLTLDDQYRLVEEIRVTINTDDPGVFSTSLAHEYYLLGEILIGRGVPEPEVVKWLDWLRKNGQDYSFLRDLPRSTDLQMKTLLKHLLENNEPILRRLRGLRREHLMPRTTEEANGASHGGSTPR